MNKQKIVYEGITYDDVLLIPRYSKILPREVTIASRLTNNITLTVPIISAAMDTITESEMAIALAREGGIGVIHKNLSIEKQAEQVDKVKRSESGMISNPETLFEDDRIGDALALMSKYRISGIPIIDTNHRLVGIITNRDLRFKPDPTALISEYMTKENLVRRDYG